jgi:hypothetical protein
MKRNTKKNGKIKAKILNSYLHNKESDAILGAKIVSDGCFRNLEKREANIVSILCTLVTLTRYTSTLPNHVLEECYGKGYVPMQVQWPLAVDLMPF